MAHLIRISNLNSEVKGDVAFVNTDYISSIDIVDYDYYQITMNNGVSYKTDHSGFNSICKFLPLGW